jgi:hypothetical protein
MKNDYQTDYRRDVIKVTARRPPRWRLLDCTRKRYENHHASAGQGLARLRGYLFNVRAEKSGPGGKIAARFRIFRRLQQLAEAIGVIFFADILPGQVAKAIEVKKRISRLVLNRMWINAELSFQCGTEYVQIHCVTFHLALLAAGVFGSFGKKETQNSAPLPTIYN